MILCIISRLIDTSGALSGLQCLLGVEASTVVADTLSSAFSSVPTFEQHVGGTQARILVSSPSQLTSVSSKNLIQSHIITAETIAEPCGILCSLRSWSGRIRGK